MSAADARPVQGVRQARRAPILQGHWPLIVTELALLLGTLVLAVIVKIHPGPLPGDLDMTITWQHLIRPNQFLTSPLGFISTITWPMYVAIQMAALVVVLALCRRWLDIAIVLLTAVAADGSNFVISQVVQRPRPTGAGLYVQDHITAFFSFPSGHVEHVVAFLGIIVFLSFQVRRPHIWLWVVRAPLIATILLMGPARLMRGEHWPSDVLGGLLWGGFWLIAAMHAYEWAAKRWPRLVPPNECQEAGGQDIPSVRRETNSRILKYQNRVVHSLAVTSSQGLSESEVEVRRLGGQGNTEPLPIARTYAQIVRHNLLTLINICLLGLGLALLALGRPMDALSAVGLICFNAVVTAAQEIRTKRMLDRTIVTPPTTVTVTRGGKEQRAAARDLVTGDLLMVGPGDHIVVDGRILEGRVVVDESRLSGKSHYALRRAGDHLLSGSICVSGNGVLVAERVGVRSIVHRLALSARSARRGPSPLQKQINFVFSLSLITAVYIELLLIVRAVIAGADLGDSVEQSAVIANLVPESVVLTIALAYAIGAVRVLRTGALAQEASAVESLSNVTVLCLDKTGTLTSSRFEVESAVPIGNGMADFQRILGDFAASGSPTRIGEAIAAVMPGHSLKVDREVPFSPERKWGAATFDDPGDSNGTRMTGVYVIGAPDLLAPHLACDGEDIGSASATINGWTEEGLFVLLVARADGSRSGLELEPNPQLPDGLKPLGFVALREELRPETKAGLAALVDAGLDMKIVSGDDLSAVAGVARQVGIPTDGRTVSGHDLAAMNEMELEDAVETARLFGGVTAEQKRKIVEALQKRGHYVGMIGDGLNDVPALKTAHVGIAMQSGSEVARDAADMVLLNDSLSTLAPIIGEGQRIVNSLQPAIKLFLTRITASALVILSSLTVAEVFPLRLRHGTILTILTVAVPTVLLALWARPGPINKDGPLRQQAHFVIPAALISSMVGLLLFYGVLMLRVLPFVFNRPHYTQAQLQTVLQKDLPTAQTELACFLVLTGLILVIFVAPPTEWWVGGSGLSGDWRPTLMALGLSVSFGILLEVPFFRSLFGLAPLGVRHLAAVVGATLLWLLLVRAVWRVQLGERLFRLERKPGAWYRHAASMEVDSSETVRDIGWQTDVETRSTGIQ